MLLMFVNNNMITLILTVHKDRNCMQYVPRLSMLCIEMSMLCKNNVDNMVLADFRVLCCRYVTDLAQICHIQETQFWQFQIQTCNRSVTDLLLASL